MKLTEKKLKQLILESLEARKAMAAEISSMNLPAGSPKVSHHQEPEDALAQYLERGRPIKQLYRKYADHDFLRKLICVHYTDLKKLHSFFDRVSPRDELSCVAYKGGENFKFSVPLGVGLPCALALKGRITLLSNNAADIISGKGGWYSYHFPERTRDSGTNKGVAVIPDTSKIAGPDPSYVLSEEDWNPTGFTGRGNEALLDNWSVFAYIVEKDEHYDHVSNLIMMGSIPRKKIYYDTEFNTMLRMIR